VLKYPAVVSQPAIVGSPTPGFDGNSDQGIEGWQERQRGSGDPYSQPRSLQEARPAIIRVTCPGCLYHFLC
jgi:hypothetical protein